MMYVFHAQTVILVLVSIKLGAVDFSSFKQT
jgi:hypothetical protein